MKYFFDTIFDVSLLMVIIAAFIVAILHLFGSVVSVVIGGGPDGGYLLNSILSAGLAVSLSLFFVYVKQKGEGTDDGL